MWQSSFFSFSLFRGGKREYKVRASHPEREEETFKNHSSFLSFPGLIIENTLLTIIRKTSNQEFGDDEEGVMSLALSIFIWSGHKKRFLLGVAIPFRVNREHWERRFFSFSSFCFLCFLFLGDYKGALPFIVRGYKGGSVPIIVVYRINL